MMITNKDIEKIVELISERLNELLMETPALPIHIKKARQQRRAKDTKDREREADRELKKVRRDRKHTTGDMEDIMDSFKSYANGIMEEDSDPEEIDEKKAACGGIRGSALYHDEKGHFTGKKDAKVRSLKKHTGSDCRHGTQRVKGKNDSIAAPAPCGSKEQTKAGGVGKHKKKCKSD